MKPFYFIFFFLGIREENAYLITFLVTTWIHSHMHTLVWEHTHTSCQWNIMMTLWIVLFSGKLRNAWECGSDLRTRKTICNLDLELTPRTTVYFVDVVQLPHSPVSVRVHTRAHTNMHISWHLPLWSPRKTRPSHPVEKLACMYAEWWPCFQSNKTSQRCLSNRLDQNVNKALKTQETTES